MNDVGIWTQRALKSGGTLRGYKEGAHVFVEMFWEQLEAMVTTKGENAREAMALLEDALAKDAANNPVKYGGAA